MIYTRDKTFTNEVFCRFQAILDGVKDWNFEGDTVTMTSVSMGDGYEINFNLTQGHDKPYLEVILFENGNEFYTWPYSDDIIGCWECVFGGEIQKAFRVETFIE